MGEGSVTLGTCRLYINLISFLISISLFCSSLPSSFSSSASSSSSSFSSSSSSHVPQAAGTTSSRLATATIERGPQGGTGGEQFNIPNGTFMQPK